MALVRKKRPRPRRVLIYGTKGIGKSTWANAWPDPWFVNIEDGLDNIECASSEWLRSYDAVISEVGKLIAGTSEGSAAKTVVIDSADWMESLTFQQVAVIAGKKSIDEIGYGKGYQSAADMFTYLLRGLDQLRDQGKHIVFIAHETVAKYSPPGGDSYDRYAPALHKETCAVLTEWVDEVLFAHYKTFTKTQDLGFDKVRTVAVGAGQPVIATRETPAIVAKNRLSNIPGEISLDFDDFAKYLPQLDFAPPQISPFNSATVPAETLQPPLPEGNIAGVIINGHSSKH